MAAAAVAVLPLHAVAAETADPDRFAEARAEWLVQQTAHLVASGLVPAERASVRRLPSGHLLLGGEELLPGGRARAAAETVSTSSYLLTGREVDGRGGDDVVEVRTESRFDGKTSTRTVAVHARDGMTGRVLWSRTTRSTKGAFTTVARVPLTTTRDRVVLLTYGGTGDDTSLVVSALDGATGRDAWRASRTGSYGYDGESFTGDDVPGVAGVVRAPDGAGELVLTSTDFVEEADYSASGSVRTSALRLRDGRSHSLAAATSETALPEAWAVGDATGDGWTDLVLLAGGGTTAVVPDPEGGPSLVQLASGRDGRTAWSRDDLVLEGYPTAGAAGPVSGTRVGARLVDDVAVVGGFRYLRGPGIRGALGQPSTTDSPLTVLRGTDGTTRWTGLGETAVPTGQGSLVTYRTREVRGRTSTELTLFVTGYDAAGAQQWVYEETVEHHDDYGFLLFFHPSVTVGDLQPDGRRDPYYYLPSIGSDGELVLSSGVLDGRSGDLLGVRPEDALGEGGTLTGKGDDVVVVEGTSGGVRLTARRGATGRALWTRTVAGPRPEGYAYAYAGPRRGRCSDVVVETRGSARGQFVVLAPDGRVRWSVDAARSDLKAERSRGGEAFTARCG